MSSQLDILRSTYYIVFTAAEAQPLAADAPTSTRVAPRSSSARQHIHALTPFTGPTHNRLCLFFLRGAALPARPQLWLTSKLKHCTPVLSNAVAAASFIRVFAPSWRICRPAAAPCAVHGQLAALAACYMLTPDPFCRAVPCTSRIPRKKRRRNKV